MDIIDFHTHIWPDKIAEKARDFLSQVYGIQIKEIPNISTALNNMDNNGISKSVIASVATRPDQVEGINNWLFNIKSERFIKFASLHPFYDKWSYELDRIKDNALGIKYQPEFQMFYIDDERIFPIYEKIQKLQIPLLVHCGLELTQSKIAHAGPKQMLNIKKYFPELKFIAPHMGSFNMWDTVEKEIIGDNYFYIDTSSSLKYMKKEQAYRFLTKHNSEKILFGSDFPIGNPSIDLKLFQQFNLNKNLLEKILYFNAKKLLNL